MQPPRFQPGDLVIGYRTFAADLEGYFDTPIGPQYPGLVLRTHMIKLMDGHIAQEVWILGRGKEERWLASELRYLETDSPINRE